VHGSLDLHRGVIWVGRQEKTAHVRAFDLEGNPLTGGFSFRDPRLGRSVAAGIGVDDDRNLWIADPPASRIRRFSAFGVEIGGLGLSLEAAPEPAAREDVAGLVRTPVDVVVRGDADRMLLAVACGGVRRHAVQLFAGDGRLRASLRSQGDPRGRFDEVRGIAIAGRYLYVAERGARRIQVFRDGDHHFHFAERDCGFEPFLPNAVAAVGDGRIVVACGGARSALLLFDASGRLLRRLADHGRSEGEVFEPEDLVVEREERDAMSSVAVIDRDGTRVQIFDLEGRIRGAFRPLAG
jgi:hypothetical protein